MGVREEGATWFKWALIGQPTLFEVATWSHFVPRVFILMGLQLKFLLLAFKVFPHLLIFAAIKRPIGILFHFDGGPWSASQFFCDRIRERCCYQPPECVLKLPQACWVVSHFNFKLLILGDFFWDSFSQIKALDKKLIVDFFNQRRVLNAIQILSDLIHIQTSFPELRIYLVEPLIAMETCFLFFLLKLLHEFFLNFIKLLLNEF